MELTTGGIIALKVFTPKLVNIGITDLKKRYSGELKPKLDRIIKQHKLKNIHADDCVESYGEYLVNAYKAHEYINSFVVQSGQKVLKELYCPLTLLKQTSVGRDDGVEIRVDENSLESLFGYKNILICDYAGMGKSTILSYLFLNIIEQGYGIPLMIELRSIANTEENDDNMLKRKIRDIVLAGRKDIFSEEIISELIKVGGFVFMFDGYDEVNATLREKLAKEIVDIANLSDKNIVFLSSREDDGLVAFNCFQKFSIREMSMDESFELIRRYGDNDDVSEELIANINKDRNLSIIKDFLENPLMTAMLYRAYKHKKKIPYKKYLFYEQVYSAVFDEHDLSKTGYRGHEKKSRLEVDDFLKVLSTLGFYLTFLVDKHSFTRIELLDSIEKSKTLLPGTLVFSNKDFFDDITHSVPFFRRDGLEYKCIHKSFLEYFSANYIAKYMDQGAKDSLLVRMLEAKGNYKFFNILDFLYDMDEESFDKIILTTFCEKYLRYCEDPIARSHTDGVRNFMFFNEKVLVRECDENIKLEMEFDGLSPRMQQDQTFKFLKYTDTDRAIGKLYLCEAEEAGLRIEVFDKGNNYQTLFNLLTMKKTPLIVAETSSNKEDCTISLEMLQLIRHNSIKLIDCHDEQLSNDEKALIYEFLDNADLSGISRVAFQEGGPILTKKKCEEFLEKMREKQHDKNYILEGLITGHRV